MKPGLYVATVWGCETSVVLGPFEEAFPWRRVVPGTNLCGALKGEEVTDPRPLVVLDPESDEDCERFGREFYAHWSGCQGSAEIAARAALRALADPKPAEPTGLGAVVRDREGATYVRVAVHFDGWAVGEMWRRVGGEVNADKRRAWSDIDVAEVLSEGWSE